MIRAVYFHATEGRIRIHIAEAKGSQEKAQKIAEKIRCCVGVTNARANGVTGNVLIYFDSRRITQADLILSLQAMGYLGGQEFFAPKSAAVSRIDSGWGAELLRLGLETLLTALIL